MGVLERALVFRVYIGAPFGHSYKCFGLPPGMGVRGTLHVLRSTCLTGAVASSQRAKDGLFVHVHRNT